MLGCCKGEDKLFSISTGSRLESNRLQWWFRLDFRRNFLLVTAVIPEKTMPMETVGSHCLRLEYWYSLVCFVVEAWIRLVLVLFSYFPPWDCFSPERLEVKKKQLIFSEEIWTGLTCVVVEQEINCSRNRRVSVTTLWPLQIVCNYHIQEK